MENDTMNCYRVTIVTSCGHVIKVDQWAGDIDNAIDHAINGLDYDIPWVTNASAKLLNDSLVLKPNIY